MRPRLTPLGLVLKWLIVPVLVGAIGYFLIGPRIGKRDLPADAPPSVPTQPVVDSRPATAPATNSVQAATAPVATPVHHRKRRRHKTEPNSVKIDGVDQPTQETPTTP
ncbi:MAG TPA: hypothetical protein VG944_04340 [Fimbriimonas sp.]|nr:hypothetical protein [Fimbriimonas sp.]